MMKEIDDKTLETLQNTPVEAGMLLRTSLKMFISVFHFYIYRKQFTFKPFHDLIIEKLEGIAFGTNTKRNLMLNLSPRSGKSQIMQYFHAWSYALNPQCNVIMASCSVDLVEKFSGQVKNIINSAFYHKLFGVQMDMSSAAKAMWKTTAGGEFRAAAMFGTIIGFGAGVIGGGFGGVIHIDDPSKATDFNSKVELQNTVDCYVNTFKSRKNNPNVPIILVMQRLSEDDLSAWIEQNEPDDWDILRIPALDENNQSIWEEQFPAKDLLKMKEMNPYLFYSQYQQSPVILGGNVFKEEWWKYYSTKDTHTYAYAFVTADTASKVQEANDESVFQLWAKTEDDQLHLIDMMHGKWDAVDLERNMYIFWNKWKWGVGINRCIPSALYIEDRSSGIALIQQFQRVGGIPIIPINRFKNIGVDGKKIKSDKLSRAWNVLGFITAGQVFLPRADESVITKEVVDQASAFKEDMSHKHDDMIDPLIDAINIAFNPNMTSSIFI